jgi:hypothetical protein
MRVSQIEDMQDVVHSLVWVEACWKSVTSSSSNPCEDPLCQENVRLNKSMP